MCQPGTAVKVTTVMGSYRPSDDGNFRANKGGERGNFEAKENPKMEIMIQGLCEIGRKLLCVVYFDDF